MMFRYKKEQSDGDFDFDGPHQNKISSRSFPQNLERDEGHRAVNEVMNNRAKPAYSDEGHRPVEEVMKNRAKQAYSIVDNFVSASTDKTYLSEGSGNMTVGPGVQMEGSIRHFEKLLILGSSEGELEGENLIIGEDGFLKGKASVRNMEIVGEFQGAANVAGHIHLRSTGIIDGQITYSSIEIENGGKISGEMYPVHNSHANEEKTDSLNENSPIVDAVEFSVSAPVDEEDIDE